MSYKSYTLTNSRFYVKKHKMNKKWYSGW